MRIMAVDDEKGSLAALTEAIKEAAPGGRGTRIREWHGCVGGSTEYFV